MHTDRQSLRPEGDQGKVYYAQGSRWARLMFTSMVGIMNLAGCGQLRFAPGEVLKQNAYLHHKTTQAAALKAHEEQTSATLQDLTNRAAQQSEAMVAYYGLPAEIPATQTVGEILSAENETLTENARLTALQRPDPWDLADNLLELGLALAGVVGGVYGTRAATALKTARQKSTALREVVYGNEIFKRSNPIFAEDFKQAQAGQSATTRQLVAQMK